MLTVNLLINLTAAAVGSAIGNHVYKMDKEANKYNEKFVPLADIRKKTKDLLSTKEDNKYKEVVRGKDNKVPFEPDQKQEHEVVVETVATEEVKLETVETTEKVVATEEVKPEVETTVETTEKVVATEEVKPEEKQEEVHKENKNVSQQKRQTKKNVTENVKRKEEVILPKFTHVD